MCMNRLEQTLLGRHEQQHLAQAQQGTPTSGRVAADMYVTHALADLANNYTLQQHRNSPQLQDGATPISEARAIYVGVSNAFMNKAVSTIFDKAVAMDENSQLIDLTNPATEDLSMQDFASLLHQKQDMRTYIILPSAALQGVHLPKMLFDVEPKYISFIQQ